MFLKSSIKTPSSILKLGLLFMLLLKSGMINRMIKDQTFGH